MIQYRHLRILAIALFLAIVAGLTQWLLWLQAGPAEVSQFVGPVRSDYTLTNFSMTSLNEQGDLAFTVTAPSLARHPYIGSYFVDQPRFEINNGDDAPWIATANNGWIRADAKELRLDNAVNVTGPVYGAKKAGQSNLKTEQLSALVEESVLSSNAAVTITQPGSILRAVGMRADAAANTLELKSQVKIHHEPIK